MSRAPSGMSLLVPQTDYGSRFSAQATTTLARVLTADSRAKKSSAPACKPLLSQMEALRGFHRLAVTVLHCWARTEHSPSGFFRGPSTTFHIYKGKGKAKPRGTNSVWVQTFCRECEGRRPEHRTQYRTAPESRGRETMVQPQVDKRWPDQKKLTDSEIMYR